MYGCKSWTIKKDECWRIDAFELWCWRRLLSVPWTASRYNQSTLKQISPECHCKDWCWSWKSNTLATWCEELTHLKRSWCWERLKVGGEGDNRVLDGWMASPTQWRWVWVNSESWWWTGRPGVLQSMGSQRGRHDWVTELKKYKTSLKEIIKTQINLKPSMFKDWKTYYRVVSKCPLIDLKIQQYLHKIPTGFCCYCFVIFDPRNWQADPKIHVEMTEIQHFPISKFTWNAQNRQIYRVIA